MPGLVVSGGEVRLGLITPQSSCMTAAATSETMNQNECRSDAASTWRSRKRRDPNRPITPSAFRTATPGKDCPIRRKILHGTNNEQFITKLKQVSA